MEKKFDVLVVGELNLDLILAGLNAFPQIGKEILAEKMSLTLGSSSAILACNLSVLGSSVCFMGKVGKDQFGQQVLQLLSEKEVNTNSILYDEEYKTGLTVALSYGNDRAMVTHGGSMEHLKADEIPDTLLKAGRHLHVSSLFLQPALKRGIISLFERAKGIGLTTSLDTQWDPNEQWIVDWKKLLPLVDVFLPNLEEIRNITGKQSPKDCIYTLKDYSHTIVIKKGTEGSEASQAGNIIEQPAFVNSQVKDTIGAGDSFNAGFLHYFLKNKPLQECMELGSLCGAINTTAYGGTTAFSDIRDIKKIAIGQFKYQINGL